MRSRRVPSTASTRAIVHRTPNTALHLLEFQPSGHPAASPRPPQPAQPSTPGTLQRQGQEPAAPSFPKYPLPHNMLSHSHVTAHSCQPPQLWRRPRNQSNSHLIAQSASLGHFHPPHLKSRLPKVRLPCAPSPETTTLPHFPRGIDLARPSLPSHRRRFERIIATRLRQFRPAARVDENEKGFRTPDAPIRNSAAPSRPRSFWMCDGPRVDGSLITTLDKGKPSTGCPRRTIPTTIYYGRSISPKPALVRRF